MAVSVADIESSNTETDLDDDGGEGKANHNHAIPRGTLLGVVNSENKVIGHVTFAPSGKHTHGEHSHNVDLPEHTHEVDSHTHTVNIPSHSHSVSIGSHSHTVTIPGHDHTVTIPAHAHEITPGIFFSGRPSSFSLYVNSKRKATFYGTDAEIDLTQYLVDASTKLIPRGSWLSIEIRPNDLAYVSIDMYVQGFVQSRGDNTV